jgi:hypothetical protein
VPAGGTLGSRKAINDIPMNKTSILGLAACCAAILAGNRATAETAAEKLGWQLAVHSYTFHWENSAPEIAECAKFFNAACEELVKE